MARSQASLTTDSRLAKKYGHYPAMPDSRKGLKMRARIRRYAVWEAHPGIATPQVTTQDVFDTGRRDGQGLRRV